MPRRNGTGPMGMGQMTGRGIGYCTGYAAPGYTNAGFGMGRGIGFLRALRFFGFARRYRFPRRGAGRMRWY